MIIPRPTHNPYKRNTGEILTIMVTDRESHQYNLRVGESNECVRMYLHPQHFPVYSCPVGRLFIFGIPETPHLSAIPRNGLVYIMFKPLQQITMLSSSHILSWNLVLVVPSKFKLKCCRFIRSLQMRFFILWWIWFVRDFITIFGTIE